MEDALIALAVLGFYGLIATLPLVLGVRHHRNLMGRLLEVGDAAALSKTGHTPPWQTHGKGSVWLGEVHDRHIRAEFRLDPKRSIYAKVRVARRKRLTEGLTLHAHDYPALKQFGFRSLKLEHDKDDLWRLVFVGGDRFALLADLNRWDPSRDKGAVPKPTGNEVEMRLCDGWLELGYRGVTTDRMKRIVEAQTALVEALETEEERPWTEAQERWDLNREADRLTGEVDGRPLSIHYGGEGTTIEVPCDTPLTAAHKDWLEGGRSLANPVLGMLIGVKGPEGIDTLLENEELAEHLLAVVHAWPGSRVAPGSVVLRAKTRLRLELAESVEHVLALARMLEQG